MSPPHRVSPRKVGWVGAPCSALPFASSPLLTPKIPGSPPAPFQHPQPFAAVPTCAGKEGWRPAALCADSRTAPQQRRFCLLARPGLQCSPSQRPPWGGRGQMSQQPPPALGWTDGRTRRRWRRRRRRLGIRWACGGDMAHLPRPSPVATSSRPGRGQRPRLQPPTTLAEVLCARRGGARHPQSQGCGLAACR